MTAACTPTEILSTLSDSRSGTVRRVNKGLALLGFEESDVEFVRGPGYFYISGDTGCSLYESAIYATPRVSGATVGEWIRMVIDLLREQPDHCSAEARAIVSRVSGVIRQG